MATITSARAGVPGSWKKGLSSLSSLHLVSIRKIASHFLYALAGLS